MSHNREWKQKVAVVTGASSGIGEAVVRLLAQNGLTVVFCARRNDRIARLEEELLSQGMQVWSQNVDLRQETAIKKLFADISDRYGRCDVLINNAGLGHKAPLMSGDTELWREMLEVNVLALAIACREAISLMARHHSGHIINVSSMSAHRVPAGSGMYAASKFAVRALTEALRLELREAANPIRVSSISPGFVETEFAEKYHRSNEIAAKTYGQYKVLDPIDIAKSIWHIIDSDEHIEIHDILLRPREQKS